MHKTRDPDTAVPTKKHNTVQKTEYAVGKRTQKKIDLQFQINMPNNNCQR